MYSSETKFVYSFKCTMGFTEGYSHNNEESVEKLVDTVQQIAEELYQKSGTYIGCVITPAIVVYRTEWGCPIGGEQVAVITSNSYFQVKDTWKSVAKDFLLTLAERLKQYTFQSEWSLVEISRTEKN